MEFKLLFVIISSIITSLVGLGVVYYKIRKDILKKDDLESRAHVTR